jgi:hypothetical protein
MDTVVVESFVWTAKVYREAEQVEVRIDVHDDGIHVATVAGWGDFQLLETNLLELHGATGLESGEQVPF